MTVVATPTPACVQTLFAAEGVILNATGQTPVNPTAQGTAGTNGQLIDAILVTSTDTSARDIIVGMTINSVNIQLGQINIPINAGNVNTTPAVNLLTALSTANAAMVPLPLDAFGNPTLKLPNGATLYFIAPVTITSGKQLNIAVFGGNM